MESTLFTCIDDGNIPKYNDEQWSQPSDAHRARVLLIGNRVLRDLFPPFLFTFFLVHRCSESL